MMGYNSNCFGLMTGFGYSTDTTSHKPIYQQRTVKACGEHIMVWAVSTWYVLGSPKHVIEC